MSISHTLQYQHLLKPPPEPLSISSQMRDVEELEEVELVVENFTEEYGGNEDSLCEEVEDIGRTDESGIVTTAKVHLVIKDEGWTATWDYAFGHSRNLWKVTATRASEVGNYAFYCCVNLTEAIFSSANSVGINSFCGCSKLTVVSLPNCNVNCC